jgi:flagellar biosynthesis regulator FlaF
VTATAANNNRVTTAVHLGRIDERLAALTKVVNVALSEAKDERRGHSRKLDALELTVARMETGKRERDKLREDVDALKTEQRIWASLNTVLGPLAAAVTAWLGGNQ